MQVIERLFAETIPGQEQATCSLVVHREGEHAVQSSWKLFPPLLVAVHEHFGVGVITAEDVTALDERATEFGVVVNLAIENHANSAILVPHRLMPAGHVNDGEPAMAQEH